MRGYSPCESSTTRSDLPPPSQGPKTSLGRAKGSGSLPICFKSPPILAPLSLNPNPNHRRPQPLSLYPNPNHHISASLSLNPDQSQSQKLQPELKEKKKWEKAKRERAEFECLTRERDRKMKMSLSFVFIDDVVFGWQENLRKIEIVTTSIFFLIFKTERKKRFFLF